MPYHHRKSRLRRRWSHWCVYRMQLLQSLDAERRWHRAQWTRRARRSDDCVVLVAQRGAARVAFLVGLTMGI